MQIFKDEIIGTLDELRWWLERDRLHRGGYLKVSVCGDFKFLRAYYKTKRKKTSFINLPVDEANRGNPFKNTYRLDLKKHVQKFKEWADEWNISY